VPEDWNVDAADFINKLLARKASCRLGYNGNQETKTHAWFSDFDWASLQDGSMIAPYIPNSSQENFD
jgi:serum/glucocorticoid-regulated kinase 2